MTQLAVYGSATVLLVCFAAYIAVALLRGRGWIDAEEAEVLLERAIEDVAWVYDPALAAPKPAAAVVVPEIVKPRPGTYTVVYWSDDRTNFRFKNVPADSPQQARQIADEHEAEYCRETGAPTYSFSRIDYPEEEQQED